MSEVSKANFSSRCTSTGSAEYTPLPVPHSRERFDSSLSTMILPRMARSAYRRGVVLKYFIEV
jgi:hypothetical protein